MEVTITIDDTLTPGGAAIKVEPELDILEKAAHTSATLATPAQVYALAVLNALKAFSADPTSVRLPRFNGPGRSLISINNPVHTVTIKLSDRADGGVTAVSDPKFSTLAAMVAGRSTITTVHQYGMVAIGRIFKLNQETRKP